MNIHEYTLSILLKVNTICISSEGDGGGRTE